MEKKKVSDCRVALRLPEDTLEKLIRDAQTYDRSVSYIIRQILSGYYQGWLMSESSSKYVQIRLTPEYYNRLDFYARHVHSEHSARDLAQRIVLRWIEQNTDPLVVESGIKRLVDKLLGICTCGKKGGNKHE